MIRNIIFDMGNVLLRFEPELFMERLGVAPEDRPLLWREIYHSREWVQMDHGTLLEADAAQIIAARVPERLRGAVEKLVTQWDRPLLEVEGMRELAAELKSMGYKLYLLSNAGKRQHDYWPRLPVSQYFDGKLISADVRLLKPDYAIYRLLCERFSLEPAECFFIDDNPPNIEAAYCCGIDGAVFHNDVAVLRRDLNKAGIPVKA
ncbi:MAG: HAD family phosphatase [Oscillospiraceae bacterium]|nr:HAD family phosphatase [Oscillospiraceae bacterium]